MNSIIFSDQKYIQLILNAQDLRSIQTFLTIQNSFEKTDCKKHTNKHNNRNGLKQMTNKQNEKTNVMIYTNWIQSSSCFVSAFKNTD